MKETRGFKLGGLFKSEQLNWCPLHHHREKRFSETPRELEKKEKKKPNKHPKKPNRPRKRSLKMERSKGNLGCCGSAALPGLLVFITGAEPCGRGSRLPLGDENSAPAAIWGCSGHPPGASPWVHPPILVSGAGRQRLSCLQGVSAGRLVAPADVAGLAEEVVVQGVAPVLRRLR